MKTFLNSASQNLISFIQALPTVRKDLKAITLIGLILGFICETRADTYTFHYEGILGTSMKLVVETTTEAKAEMAEQTALSEIDRLESILSTYKPDSDFNRLLGMPTGTPWYAPKEIIEILVACDWWSMKTAGAFNPQIGSLSAIWKSSAEQDQMPESKTINQVRSDLHDVAWQIDGSYEMVTMLKETKLSLDAIAKGYIIDRTCEAVMESTEDIESVLLSIGGDIRIKGTSEKTIGITNPQLPAENQRPLAELLLWDHSVATSANYARGFQIQGKRYSQIIDPRTGYPVKEDILSATVISESATQADALSTTLLVLTPQEGIQLIESLPRTECLLVLQNGDLLESSGFNMFLIQKGSTDETRSWNEQFTFELDFEINRPGGRRYHRPYVAIWIEDDSGQVVKTLCLWMERGSKWISKLTRWRRTKGLELETVRTLTRATRMPGRYHLAWNGIDDQGAKVNSGTYTLFIEAVREHGTHQLIRETFTAGEDPFEKEIKGNIEITNIHVRYGFIDE